MICPNCGKLNKDSSKFCFECGAKLTVPIAAEIDIPSIDPEDEKTVLMHDIENEKTEILYDTNEFENEETVIIDDEEDELYKANAFESYEDEETVVLNDLNRKNKSILDEEKVPNFKYTGHVPVFKEDVAGTNHDTAYIDHLRALKQLWDDGIITEDEFTQKKKQILGL